MIGSLLCSNIEESGGISAVTVVGTRGADKSYVRLEPVMIDLVNMEKERQARISLSYEMAGPVT